MPGENCSIYGCGTCRRPQFKGMSIFQVPEFRKGPGNEAHNKWRIDFLNEVAATRLSDAEYKTIINSNNVYACELHFSVEDYNIFVCPKMTKKKLKFGAIPRFNMPEKIMRATKTVREPPRKREFVPPPEKDCYTSFRDLCTRTRALKILDIWNLKWMMKKIG